MSIQHQIEQLRIGGYRDEAASLEYFANHINCAKEFEYLFNFAKSGDFDFKLCRNQLRALWTAYCFHANTDVDTARYDSDLQSVWEAMPPCSEMCEVDWHDFDSFDDFMCQYLV